VSDSPSIYTTSNLPQESLTGVIERITFNSEETGYTVARLQAPRCHELITIVGNFANIQAGQTLQLQGTWREHAQYGQQFQVVHYKETKPATLTGIEKYLGSGLIKGVGPITAKRIVAYFGLDTLEIVETQSERLIEVPGIGKKRVRTIQRAWNEQKAIKEVMLFLQSHGVSTTYAVKIFKQYGDKSIAVVTNNPYQLAADIYGIGFLTADTIARNLGVSPASPFRLAWSISIHKSQGSEYPVVILPLYMQHYLLLSRNLVYTGLTRAKQLAIVVGSNKAIGLAVRNCQVGKRYTRLPERLGGTGRSSFDTIDRFATE
jgi:exodeoxyribonuclease V alpha subunit